MGSRSSLIPPLDIELPLPSHATELSYMCVRSIDVASFKYCASGLWSCTESVIMHLCVASFYYCAVIFWSCTESVIIYFCVASFYYCAVIFWSYTESVIDSGAVPEV